MKTNLQTMSDEAMAMKYPNRFLKPGTLAVSHEDGEPGLIQGLCSPRRSGVGAYSYVMKTRYGREIWYACDLFVPDVDQHTQDVRQELLQV
jgi:hypothetical protein